MAIQADEAYLRQREQSLNYEDARFKSLTANVADCYPTPTDYTLWGSILRAVAQELARLDYAYAYDLVSLDPQYLTPPDIKRIYAAPLEITSSYPGPDQSDIAYKQILVDLIPAYLKGTTVEAIADVIKAYTGQTVVVEELYEQIGNGIYDDSDRNTIQVALNAQTINPLTEGSATNVIQTLAQNLYSAIDLAKPAHVGLNYSLVFGGVENVGALISRITDTLRITLYGVEEAPAMPLFTFYPFEQPTSPDTRLLFISPPQTPVTGETAGVEGILSPRRTKAWQIKKETLRIYRLS